MLTSQIAKVLRSMSIRHRSDAKVLDHCLIDGDPSTRVFAIWAETNFTGIVQDIDL